MLKFIDELSEKITKKINKNNNPKGHNGEVESIKKELKKIREQIQIEGI